MLRKQQFHFNNRINVQLKNITYTILLENRSLKFLNVSILVTLQHRMLEKLFPFKDASKFYLFKIEIEFLNIFI